MKAIDMDSKKQLTFLQTECLLLAVQSRITSDFD